MSAGVLSWLRQHLNTRLQPMPANAALFQRISPVPCAAAPAHLCNFLLHVLGRCCSGLLQLRLHFFRSVGGPLRRLVLTRCGPLGPPVPEPHILNCGYHHKKKACRCWTSRLPPAAGWRAAEPWSPPLAVQPPASTSGGARTGGHGGGRTPSACHQRAWARGLVLSRGGGSEVRNKGGVQGQPSSPAPLPAA